MLRALQCLRKRLFLLRTHPSLLGQRTHSARQLVMYSAKSMRTKRSKVLRSRGEQSALDRQ